jgi:hypothetical protein
MIEYTRPPNFSRCDRTPLHMDRVGDGRDGQVRVTGRFPVSTLLFIHWYLSPAPSTSMPNMMIPDPRAIYYNAVRTCSIPPSHLDVSGTILYSLIMQF